MTAAQEAAALRTLARALLLIEERVGSLGAHMRTSDDTADVLASAGIKLAVLIDALELQAEMMAPTSAFSLAQLDLGLSVRAVRL